LNVVAASAALNTVKSTYCPPTLNNEMLSDPLTKVVRGRNVCTQYIKKYLIFLYQKMLKPSPTLMWSKIEIPVNLQSFIPNHFVVLNHKKLLLHQNYLTFVYCLMNKMILNRSMLLISPTGINWFKSTLVIACNRNGWHSSKGEGLLKYRNRPNL